MLRKDDIQMSHLLFPPQYGYSQTPLDKGVPSCTSEAVLQNRKNAWIQLAGHMGSFSPAGPHTIWKKRISKENYEMKAYQALMESPATRDIIPEFFCEVEHNGEYFIEIEDLLYHFKDPNIMDIKMGKRTFLESEVRNPALRKDLYEKMVSVDCMAPTDEERKQKAITKLRYMQFREEESSTSSLGFRIEAIRNSGESPTTSLKKVKTRNQVMNVISKFLERHPQSIRHILQRLKTIRVKFAESNFFKNHEIIGSSLLIMYDEVGHSGVWMIDFAKTIPVENGMILHHNLPWQLGNREDGFLCGLDNLIKIFSELIEGQKTIS
ncbi:inositol-trisphosphate 3-kinase homolog [Patella vulgata]|uniref:inositol-trisphosphate 3-kinase homolog n=1 Tax=Patella vulgata TaxID=6465 RepID=UPI0021804F62|nr:inositol-trisphosphate 3-kinase homolog [Patella vulgata]XP_050419391.1 inositol-trisphosphate 3-kinase homolog [Patella vulgata]